MHSGIMSMLEKYELKNLEDRKHAIKEIVQEVTLLGLYRSGFFNYATFYGGTCLRIFYGLNRFSEDLDFSLIHPDTDFTLSKYSKYVKDELGSFGFDMQVIEKSKSQNSNIRTAFIKGGTKVHLLRIVPSDSLIQSIHSDELIKIKLEVDINPPKGATFENKYHLNPIAFSVKTYTLDSLFAGKVHALLCRSWGSRVKGRDFYDYIWYLSKGIKLNIMHLESRMKQSGHLKLNKRLTQEVLNELLIRRFNEVDFEQAKQDVIPFIHESKEIEAWCKEMFVEVTKNSLHIV